MAKCTACNHVHKGEAMCGVDGCTCTADQKAE